MQWLDAVTPGRQIVSLTWVPYLQTACGGVPHSARVTWVRDGYQFLAATADITPFDAHVGDDERIAPQALSVAVRHDRLALAHGWRLVNSLPIFTHDDAIAIPTSEADWYRLSELERALLDVATSRNLARAATSHTIAVPTAVVLPSRT